MKEVTEEFYDSAMRLAECIDSDDENYNSFLVYIRNPKNDPTKHIYYDAAIVGGWTDTIELENIQK